MKIIVNPHDVKIKTSEKVNENEYNITKCEFEFSEEYTDDLVKVALFTNSAGTYKQIIFNNECNIPAEILEKNESTILGVYSYKEENEELILRYSPTPIKFFISKGSYVENAENSEPITPSELEQYQQALQNGLNELESAVEQAENLDININKVDDTTTVTIIDKTGTPKSENIKDGKDGIDGKDGKDGKDYVITEEDYQEIANVVETDIQPILDEKIDKDVDNLTYYTLGVDTGHSIELNINSSTYLMTLNLKNSDGTTISTDTIDLPLESVVVSGTYDSTNKQIVLALQNGSTIDIPVGDLISGLQTEITSNNKLSSDLVDDTNNTNKFVTSAEKTTWNGKYNKPSGGIPKTDLSSSVQTSLGKADTAIQDISGKQDTIDSLHKLSSDLVDDTNQTNKFVTENEKTTWNGKVSQTNFENSQAVQDNAINNINNELDAFFKKTVSGTEIYLKQTLNWKMKLKINGNTGGVTGNNTINILSKNVYNKNTPTEHIYYDDTGNPQTDNTRDFINIDIPVFDKFVISYSGKSGGASFIRVIQYDDNNNFVRRSLISTNNQVITTESNTARVLVSANAGPNDYFTNLQIERGEIPTTYSEYQSQSYPINLGNIILNENDYIYKNNGNWYTKISGTDTQITDNNLIEQLNTMNNNATSFEEITYIYSNYASSPINFNADIYVSMAPDLSDYVKNTDFAQNSSIIGGVVRYANGVYGIRNVQNGYVGIVKPTDAEIEAQSTGWRVLTPAQLSKAVKEGVTNNSITLTSAEKEVARNWLGLERSWKKIRSITIPSDDYKGQTINGVFYNYEGENGIKNFSFSTDSDGNSLEGKGITGYILKLTPTTNINVNQAFIGVSGNSMIVYTTNIKNTTNVFWYEFGIGPAFAEKTNNNPGQYRMGNRVNLGKELTSFIFNGWEATSVLGEGSVFDIWAYGYWD